MGVMDGIRSQTRPSGGSGFMPFASSDEKQALVDAQQPFQVMGVRGPNPSTKVGWKPNWHLDVIFLDGSRPNDGGDPIQDDDGEGNTILAGRTLTFSSSDSRDPEFQMLKQMVAQSGMDGVGPLFMAQVPVKGQSKPAFILQDWPPGEPAGVGPAVMAPATQATVAPQGPQGQVTSPDGKFYWDGQKWLPMPPPPTETEPPNVSVAAVLPFLTGAAEGPSATPAPGVAQAPPETETVVGSDGEGGQVATTRTKGPVRQALYRGDGVVAQPTGVTTQNVAPDSPPEARSIVQEAAEEEAPTPTPEPPPESTAGISESVPTGVRSGRIMTQTVCPDCGETQKGSPFQDRHGKYILTHRCKTGPKPGASRILDVDEQVKALLKEA